MLYPSLSIYYFYYLYIIYLSIYLQSNIIYYFLLPIYYLSIYLSIYSLISSTIFYRLCIIHLSTVYLCVIYLSIYLSIHSLISGTFRCPVTGAPTVHSKIDLGHSVHGAHREVFRQNRGTF
jgi:hypothetical protein